MVLQILRLAQSALDLVARFVNCFNSAEHSLEVPDELSKSSHLLRLTLHCIHRRYRESPGCWSYAGVPASTSTPPTPQSKLSAAILSSIAVRVTSSQYALIAYACWVMVQACILVEVLNLFRICSQNERASPRVASPLMKRSSAAAACVMSSSLDESESPSTAKANWGPGGS